MSRFWMLLIGLCGLAITGCSSPSGATTGFVRFSDGEPVRSGSVEFRSLADGSRFAGRIDQSGQFSLASSEGKPGCPPGEYEVVVVQIVLTEDLPLRQHTHGRTVPRRYADYHTSGLRITSEPSLAKPLEVVLPTDA